MIIMIILPNLFYENLIGKYREANTAYEHGNSTCGCISAACPHLPLAVDTIDRLL